MKWFKNGKLEELFRDHYDLMYQAANVANRKAGPMLRMVEKRRSSLDLLC
jgi:hypothetical protein